MPVSTVRTHTPEQRKILDSIGLNTTVSAGAGTGKTGVMVDRFIRIVMGSAAGELHESLSTGVGGILTFTFTEAAATELKHRLVSEMGARAMIDERREVETAYISTIHGFCQRLLRENPFEAGLDPQFGVLANGENALLLEAAFEQIVDAGFRDSLPEVTDLFMAFSTARRYGDTSSDPVNMLRRESLSLCELFRSRGWRLPALLDWLKEGPESILAANLKLIAAHLNHLSETAAGAIAEMELLAVGTPCAIEEARLQLLECRQHLGHLTSPDQQLAARCVTLLDVRKLLGKTSSRKGADPAAVEGLKERFRALASLLDENKKLLGEFDFAFETESARQAYWLLALTARLWQRHEELKRKDGKLDFNDLQSITRDLLIDNPGVLERYRRRLRHVMVDEFQDTDDLQHKIVSLLRGERNLFCVGDPKQSIYGFRNADVTIFGKLIQETKQSDPEFNIHLPLTHNFRCRPEIITFVNHTFAALGVGEGIDYEPLVSGSRFDDRTEPCIEILLAPHQSPAGKGQNGPAAAGNPAAPGEQAPGNDQPDYSPAAEADLVARRIRQIVDSGAMKITATGERQGDPFQYKDFMVLLRTFTTLQSYERAFEKHGVDYYIVGGRGYYALREIRDISNLLRVIQNPLDDVSLAAALRSPFCGLSDEALYQISQWGKPGKRGSMYAGVVRALEGPQTGEAPLPGMGEMETADYERLDYFWELVERMRREEDRTPVATILEELLDKTLYEARLLLQPGGRRKMANVRKLVVSASARNTCGVAEFLQSLEQLSRVQEKEGEAPMEEEAANVVRIRTIHNAKGLEAQVVVLGGLSRNLQPSAMQRPAFLFDLQSGAGGCQYPAPETFKSRGSAAYALLSQERDRRDADETLRLLYVAMTRAREHLILAGAFPARYGSWATRLLPILGISGPPDDDRIIEPAPGVRVLVRSKVPAKRRGSAVSRTLLESIQLRMKSGQPIELADLENLQRALGSAS